MLIKDFLDKFISKSIITNKTANIVLSGGKSPLKLYKYMARQNFKWGNVKLSLLDERIVKNRSKFSNFLIVKKIFDKKIKKENFVNMIDCFKKKKIKSLIKDYTINKPIIIAGFGDDGHFASIFPSSKFYSKLINLRKKKYIFKVEKIGEPCVERITMNLSLVINSKKIILVISNKKKKRLFKHFINKNNKKNTTVKILVKNAKNKLLIYNNKRLYVLREFLRNNLA